MARAQNSDSSELLMARESLNNLCQHILKMTTPHHTIETHNHDSSDNVEWGLGSSRSGRGANNAAISLVTLSQKQVEDEQEKLAYNDSHVIQKKPTVTCLRRCPALLLIFFPSTDTNRKAVVAMPPSLPHTSCILALDGWDCFGHVMPATPLLLLHLLLATSSLDCVKSRNSHKSPSETQVYTILSC